jgi:NADH-quinone oxidoreductase subunit E
MNRVSMNRVSMNRRPMNQLQMNYPQEIQQILAKYPPEQKSSAVMPLLYLAQRETGYVSKQSILDIAEIAGLSPTDVDAIIGFYTLYHDKPYGRYHIQVCTDLPCALRGAETFLHQLCANMGIKVGETSPDGLVIIEEVTCLAGCHRAPMFQLQGDGEITYYEDQTVETALAVIGELRDRAARREGKHG